MRTTRSRLRVAGLVIFCLAAVAACERGSGTRLIVSDEVGGLVVIVDPDRGKVEERIPVGKRPRGLRLSSDKQRVFVALSGSPVASPGVDESTLPQADRNADGIGVVDLRTRRLIRTYPSGQDPETFDLSLDGRLMYVSNEETAEMSVVDLEAGRIVQRVPVGAEPEGVTVSPDGRTVFVTCEGANEIVGIDTASNTVVARIPTGPRPRAAAFTPDGSTVFVTAENGASITVVDTHTRRLASTILLPRTGAVPPRPMGLVLSPDGERLFVSNGRARSISTVDVHARRVLRTIEDAGARPWGIGVSPDGTTIFTADGPSGDVAIIDVGGGVRRRIHVGGSPWGLIVWPPQNAAASPRH